MTLPNLITIGRLLIVPLVVVMIGQGQWATAFLLFVAAGASDAVDGFIARRFDMRDGLTGPRGVASGETNDGGRTATFRCCPHTLFAD